MISEFSLRCLVIFKNQVLVLKSQQKPLDDFLRLILDILPSLYKMAQPTILNFVIWHF